MSSKGGVAPWGHHLWIAIHYVAMGYPDQPTEQDKKNYATFLRSVGPVLPCKMCVGHFERLVTEEVPLDSDALASRESLFEWSVRAHNKVNQRLGKKEMTVEEARTYLLLLRSPDETSRDYSVYIASSAVLILVVLFAWWFLAKKGGCAPLRRSYATLG